MSFRFYHRPGRARLLAEIRKQWGREEDRDRDLDALSERYETYRSKEGIADPLDDATWADLNMDEVYWTLDRTRTSAGETMLYTMLRDITRSGDVLAARTRAANRITQDTSLRETLLLGLQRLGRDTSADLTGLLWGDPQTSIGRPWLFNALALAALLSPVSLLVLGPHALLYLVLPIYLVNCLLTQVIVRGDVLTRLRTLRYLGNLISTAQRLASSNHPDLAPWTDEMARAARSTARIARGIRVLNPEASFSTEVFDTVAYYVSVFFLVEVRTFNRVMADVSRLRDDLKTVVRLVGELDALQSVASFRAGLAHYCDPEFVDDEAGLAAPRGRLASARGQPRPPIRSTAIARICLSPAPTWRESLHSSGPLP